MFRTFVALVLVGGYTFQMSLHSNNPHDGYAKRVFTDLVLVREFLSLNLPPSLVSQLDLNTLQIIDGEFVDDNHRVHQSDILYQVMTRSSAPLILYALVEHKSYPDKWVIVQILRYMISKWEQDIGNGSNQLTPIIPILFYHGQSQWSHPTTLRAYFPQNDVWDAFVPNYELVLQDYSEKSAKVIDGSLYLQAVLRAFRAIKAKNILDAFAELVEFLLTNLELDDPRGLKTIDEIGYYWSESATNISPETFEAVFKRFGRKGELALKTFATKMRTEGQEDALQDAVIDTLEARFGTVTSGIREKIGKLHDLEQLRRLVPNAALTESLTAFEEELA